MNFRLCWREEIIFHVCVNRSYTISLAREARVARRAGARRGRGGYYKSLMLRGSKFVFDLNISRASTGIIELVSQRKTNLFTTPTTTPRFYNFRGSVRDTSELLATNIATHLRDWLMIIRSEAEQGNICEIISLGNNPRESWFFFPPPRKSSLENIFWHAEKPPRRGIITINSTLCANAMVIGLLT